MKVFLTGATGYIGAAIADALQKSNHYVIGLARSTESAEKLRSRGIEPHHGDLRDKESLRAAASSADAAIHAASPNDATSAELDNIVLDAILAEFKGTSKPFLYTSGIWVLGRTGDRVADEQSVANPIPLVAWRADCEKKVLAAANKLVRAGVIRPGIVYGRGAGIPASMIEWAKERGIVVYVGNGENHWPTVHVSDLADLYVRVLDDAPLGAVFHGTNKGFVRVREVAEAMGEILDLRNKVEPWPLEQARKKLGPYADALALDQQVSSERTRERVGWSPIQHSLLDDIRGGSYKGLGVR